MTIETKQVTAIKEFEVKFDYCSICHKFRQVNCYLENKAVCVSCTIQRQLAVIDPPPKTKNKQRARIGKSDENLEKLKLNVLLCLEKQSLCSKELYVKVGKEHYSSYDSFIWFLRRLQNEGVIISRRWLASGPKYHALPSKQDLIYKRIGREPEHRVIKILEEAKSMPVSNIGRKAGLSRASAYGICRRIEKNSGMVKLEKSACGQIVASLIDSQDS